ncbi:MAG: class I SAM-dependent methyltransferase [Chlorobiaceae bacterium]
MRKEEYFLMSSVEESMWWYRTLHQIVANAIKHYADANSITLLDAGCGTGGMLKFIGDRFPSASLYGLELMPEACDVARLKSGADIKSGTIEYIEHSDSFFDVVVSLDVLGYDLDRNLAVSEFNRVLKPGGTLLLNLAAYQWLHSYHDKAVGQKSRFTLRDVNRMLERHGFRKVYGSYWNFLLFPLMVLRRKFVPGGSASDVKPFHPVLDYLFSKTGFIETLILDKGIVVPFGGSVFLVMRKK